MKRGGLVLALAVVAVVLWLRWPSASSVVSDTWIDREEGWLEYDGVRFEAEWGPEVVYEGTARIFERAKYRSAPFFTHHVALATGDYADPSLVAIEHQGGGNFFWTAPTAPQGTLVVLHLVPLDEDVLRVLGEIGSGDRVELVGRVEVDSRVSGADGRSLRLTHGNHKYVLVERATLLPD